MDHLLNADTSGRRNALKPSRNIDAIAKDIVAINYNIADIDADAELDLLVRRQFSTARRHRALDVDGATNRINCAGELHQDAVASSLHDAPAMLRKLWVKDGFAESFECTEGALLVAAHQTTVAYDVSRRTAASLRSTLSLSKTLLRRGSTAF